MKEESAGSTETTQGGAQSLTESRVWELLPSYLIDKCEGEIISEEFIQGALAEMLADKKWLAKCEKVRLSEQADKQQRAGEKTQKTDEQIAREAAEHIVRRYGSNWPLYQLPELSDIILSAIREATELGERVQTSKPREELVRETVDHICQDLKNAESGSQLERAIVYRHVSKLAALPGQTSKDTGRR